MPGARVFLGNGRQIGGGAADLTRTRAAQRMQQGRGGKLCPRRRCVARGREPACL
jgi:hypothetical protein